MATGVRGPAGQFVRGSVTEELVFGLGFVKVLLHSTEVKFVRGRGSWKSPAMRNPVPVSMTDERILFLNNRNEILKRLRVVWSNNATPETYC